MKLKTKTVITGEIELPCYTSRSGVLNAYFQAEKSVKHISIMSRTENHNTINYLCDRNETIAYVGINISLVPGYEIIIEPEDIITEEKFLEAYKNMTDKIDEEITKWNVNCAART